MSSAEPVITDNTAPPEPAALSTPEPVSTPEPASWRESLSPDLRNNPTLEQIPDIEALAKAHVNVQKLIGTEKIERPKEDWTDDQYAEFYSKLGRPADVADYDIEGIDVPEGLPWDDGFQTSMLKVMHEAGLTSNQVKKVLGGYIEGTGGQFQEATTNIAQARESGIQDLRNEWGKSFDSQIDLAKRAFMAGAGENFESVAGMTLQDGSQLGDHPSIIRAFAALGGKMNEHGLVGGSASRTTLSPSEASGERNKLLNDSDFLAAYTDSSNLEHNAAVKRINDLTIAEVGSG